MHLRTRAPGFRAPTSVHRRGTFHVLALLCMVVAIIAPAPSQARGTDYVAVRPGSIDFGKKHVGGEYYKRTKITNVSGEDVRLLVHAGLPDDFGFGLMPGSNCPVLDGGAVVEPGASCYAVVRFSPTEGFAGWFAQGEMWADSFDPVTGELLEHRLIPVTGLAVL